MAPQLSFTCDELSNKKSSLVNIITQMTIEAALCFFYHRLDCFFELVFGKMYGHDLLLIFETIDPGPWELVDIKIVVSQKSKTL